MGAGILVVDDDPAILELLRMRLESADYAVTTAEKEEEALAAVKGHPFALSIVDLKLGQANGIDLMEEIHSVAPEMPVIILTAHGTIESAVEAMRRGAYSYLTKPFEAQDLFLQMEKALENRRLVSEVKRLKGLLEDRYDFANIFARSKSMEEVLEMVTRVANTESTIYIHGESGTGKELIAKAIHLASGRKDKPFVAINCAALPESLLESQLFGHEKGA
ncbi:MAG TPA: response regulator, partial [Thermodesulfobacteriota bacterium]|nr:response regulator [Thermodesulfobacteriota bacterium]